MVDVQNLCKSYGDRMAIENLNFSVGKGEVVGFLGPNGAGKSTTMKIITGFMAPTSGDVQVAGYDVFEEPLEVKRRIGYLPETPPVYGEMVVQDYLGFVADLKKVEKPKVSSFVDMAIEKTALGDVRHRSIQHLSKGFRQRVGIAQALVSNPEILILDEPTVGLDPKQVTKIRGLIQGLKGEHTVILSTHILPEVQASCERIIIINHGRIVAEDSLSGLSARMSGGCRLTLKVRRKMMEVKEALEKIDGVSKVNLSSETLYVDVRTEDSVIEEVSECVVEKGAGLIELTTSNLGLEDIFLKLTKEEQQEVVS